MLPENSLQNKTIIVTGGGTGLGKSMTKYFIQLGAKVLISSRKEEVLKQTCAELTAETGGQIAYFVCDVREYLQVEKMIEYAIEKFGSFDVLVNNAAGNFISPTERLSPKAFDVIVDIVMKGTYNCTLAAGKYWIKNELKACVLNIVTTYAWTGSGYVVPSAMAKAGVLAMTRSLAAEWGRRGIRHVAIAPGPFPTEGAFSRLLPKEVMDVVDPKSKIPMGRFGEHQELANLASYLISDYAAYINGEVVTIDGGEWMYGAGEFNWFNMVPDTMWDEIEKSVRGKNK
jgi:NAD(P)-dependent dehydrogenase (short-subunit alcohol dehydrogenase family)